MKKGLKIWLIIGVSLLVVGGAWAGLTKTGIIPNWFDIGILCPKNTLEDIKIIDDIDNNQLGGRSGFKEPLRILDSQKWKGKMEVKTDL